ncbi:MAG: nuclear transport factor 2 family protein [Oceanicaulis sp.]
MTDVTTYAKKSDDDRDAPKLREFGQYDHPNAKMLKDAHEAFQNGDMDKLFSIFADDMTWRVPGNNKLSGVFVGKDQIVANFATLAEVADTYWAHPIDYFGSEDHVALVAEVRATRGEETLQEKEVLLFRVENGKLAECWHLGLDPEGWDRFFS